MPNEPLVIIEPSKGWKPVNLGDLWNYRELLYFLTWRDLKVRYKQTIFGVAWVVMQPLMMTLIFTIFLGMLVRVPTGGSPYALFVYLGLLPWTFFSSAVVSSGNSLIGNANLITKVYFPRVIAPMAAVGARVVDLLIAFIILAGLMLYYQVSPSINLLMLPVLVVLITLLALGCGMLISALNVKYRDVGIALPVIVQLWMFVSPVMYPASLVPKKYEAVYALNPLVGIIGNFRVALLGGTFEWRALAVSAVIAAVVLSYAAYLFRRTEKDIADVL